MAADAERTVTVNQSDPNRGRYDPARVGKLNLADTKPYPTTSPEVAEATRAELAKLRHPHGSLDSLNGDANAR